jgi:hypothetical protein
MYTQAPGGYKNGRQGLGQEGGLCYSFHAKIAFNSFDKVCVS